ncbi:MAG: hypothetical protein KGY66_02585 [Candidatus Thermoplasmatota archaeon]|nr:hypothetical protein [Candidatus Thermoplasmatota archaeon]MBS3789780.1 hypothetical protein [Candidatus Thermoplasmatota archaeon]
MNKNKSQLQELIGEVFKLEDLIDYQKGAVVSRTLVDKDQVTLTVFAFDQGQTLSQLPPPEGGGL